MALGRLWAVLGGFGPLLGGSGQLLGSSRRLLDAVWRLLGGLLANLGSFLSWSRYKNYCKKQCETHFQRKALRIDFYKAFVSFSSVWEAFEVLRASLGRLWVALGRLLGRLLGGSWAALGGSQANLESRSPKLLPYRFLQRFFASGPVPVITGSKPSPVPPPDSMGYFEGGWQGVWG